VIHYKSLVPAYVAGIEKYLGSGFSKGIGPGIAKWIVRKFEKDPLSTTSAQLSSPQMLGEDIRILSSIFPGKVICIDLASDAPVLT
jgi:hypothetical protein